ncbi:MAG: response regulator transcription factor [Anaerolineae bacterium]|nr:response regulator transcription factor [Anaerolineae bacterium]
MDLAAKILVVDDDPAIRFYLEEVLERDGHRVVAVDSGEAALEKIGRQEFDLALIDLKMGKVGGLDVLQALAQQAPETVVIILTGHASLETAVHVLRHGAHDYLFKPCRTVELRGSVQRGLLKRRRLLQQRALLEHLGGGAQEYGTAAGHVSAMLDAPPVTEAQARFIQQGSLIVDLMRHVATLEGQLLDLSPTEFDLLSYMAGEAPRVLSPQELVREVQGYESDPREAGDLVRYHIYRLRRKIKKITGRADIIRTVRRVGYTLEE